MARRLGSAPCQTNEELDPNFVPFRGTWTEVEPRRMKNQLDSHNGLSEYHPARLMASQSSKTRETKPVIADLGRKSQFNGFNCLDL
jgi:hypothetical protein